MTGIYILLKDGDLNSLTTDNLERHGQLSHHPVLPDGGALLSEAKLQSIMSFLDEMEKSEQERPRSVTSGSHREVRNSFFLYVVARAETLETLQVVVKCMALIECSCFCPQALLSEEDLVGFDHASAAAAEGSMMRIKMELDEKKRTVNMLQAALVRTTHTSSEV